MGSWYYSYSACNHCSSGHTELVLHGHASFFSMSLSGEKTQRYIRVLPTLAFTLLDKLDGVYQKNVMHFKKIVLASFYSTEQPGSSAISWNAESRFQQSFVFALEPPNSVF